jgi:hypothetical protein
MFLLAAHYNRERVHLDRLAKHLSIPSMFRVHLVFEVKKIELHRKTFPNMRRI